VNRRVSNSPILGLPAGSPHWPKFGKQTKGLTMPAILDEREDIWKIVASESETEASHYSYFEALPLFLNSFHKLFQSCKEACEFEFLWTLLGVRGMQDSGWDPYETTVDMFDSIKSIYPHTDGVSRRHLALWVYGHIMEAAEPYEILANLLHICQGNRFKVSHFDDLSRGPAPPSPG